MSSEEIRSYNMALERCPLCMSHKPEHHVHGRNFLILTTRPDKRQPDPTDIRPNYYHAVNLDLRGNFVCSCEYGQVRQRRRGVTQYGEIMKECCHVHPARFMWVEGITRLAVMKSGDRYVTLYPAAGSEGELFDGEEVEAVMKGVA